MEEFLMEEKILGMVNPTVDAIEKHKNHSFQQFFKDNVLLISVMVVFVILLISPCIALLCWMIHSKNNLFVYSPTDQRRDTIDNV